MLFQAILPHTRDLHSAYLFLPPAKRETAAIWQQLGFQVERYSFVLYNHEPGTREVQFPAGFSVESLARRMRPQERLRALINQNFAGSPATATWRQTPSAVGSRTRTT